jgi:coenzyme F420-reducing hydrogenase alpha subunit/coenzyme F420-reducing hydrogenase gamma subunit
MAVGAGSQPSLASLADIDILIVEGAVATADAAAALRAAAASAHAVIQMGACALTTGIWGRSPQPPLPVSEVIEVGYRIAGCPIETGEFIAVLHRALSDVLQLRSKGDVLCGSCRLTGRACFYDAGELCLGLVTNDGCDALCVALGRPCLGCRGLSAQANIGQARVVAQSAGISSERFDTALQLFSGRDSKNWASEPESCLRQDLGGAYDNASSDGASSGGARGSASSGGANVNPRPSMSSSSDDSSSPDDTPNLANSLSDRPDSSDPLPLVPHFDQLLVGRHVSEIAFLAPRACGGFTVAHALAALAASEQAFAIQPSPCTMALRELLLRASYLQGHASHLYFRVIPAFRGEAGVFSLSQSAPDLFAHALTLRQLGSDLLRTAGGHAAHPLTAVIGGFSCVPEPKRLQALAVRLDDALDAARTSVDLIHSFNLAALGDGCGSKAGDVAALDCAVATQDALLEDAPAAVFDCAPAAALIRDAITRDALAGDAPAAALSRVNSSWDALTRPAKLAAAKIGLRPVEPNPWRNPEAEAIELVEAAVRCAELCRELAEELAQNPDAAAPVASIPAAVLAPATAPSLPATLPPATASPSVPIATLTPPAPSPSALAPAGAPPAVTVASADAAARVSEGTGIVEAPQGTVRHRYSFDAAGFVVAARITGAC